MSLTRIVLVGAPNSGKSALAHALPYQVSAINDKHLIGPLTDYRVELSVAIKRAEAMATYAPTVFVHSVLNNLAHVCVYSADAVGVDEATAKRLILLGGVTYALVQDSFKADLIFYLPYQGEVTDDGFTEELDILYPEIFAEFDLQYVTLSGTLEENISQALKEIEAHIANSGSEGSGTTSSLPDVASTVDSR